MVEHCALFLLVCSEFPGHIHQAGILMWVCLLKNAQRMYVYKSENFVQYRIVICYKKNIVKLHLNNCDYFTTLGQFKMQTNNLIISSLLHSIDKYVYHNKLILTVLFGSICVSTINR